MLLMLVMLLMLSVKYIYSYDTRCKSMLYYEQKLTVVQKPLHVIVSASQ